MKQRKIENLYFAEADDAATLGEVGEVAFFADQEAFYQYTFTNTNIPAIDNDKVFQGRFTNGRWVQVGGSGNAEFGFVSAIQEIGAPAGLPTVTPTYDDTGYGITGYSWGEGTYTLRIQVTWSRGIPAPEISVDGAAAVALTSVSSQQWELEQSGHFDYDVAPNTPNQDLEIIFDGLPNVTVVFEQAAGVVFTITPVNTGLPVLAWDNGTQQTAWKDTDTGAAFTINPNVDVDRVEIVTDNGASLIAQNQGNLTITDNGGTHISAGGDSGNLVFNIDLHNSIALTEPNAADRTITVRARNQATGVWSTVESAAYPVDDRDPVLVWGNVTVNGQVLPAQANTISDEATITISLPIDGSSLFTRLVDVVDNYLEYNKATAGGEFPMNHTFTITVDGTNDNKSYWSVTDVIGPNNVVDWIQYDVNGKTSAATPPHDAIHLSNLEPTLNNIQTAVVLQRGENRQLTLNVDAGISQALALLARRDNGDDANLSVAGMQVNDTTLVSERNVNTSLCTIDVDYIVPLNIAANTTSSIGLRTGSRSVSGILVAANSIPPDYITYHGFVEQVINLNPFQREVTINIETEDANGVSAVWEIDGATYNLVQNGGAAGDGFRVQHDAGNTDFLTITIDKAYNNVSASVLRVTQTV